MTFAYAKPNMMPTIDDNEAWAAFERIWAGEEFGSKGGIGPLGGMPSGLRC